MNEHKQKVEGAEGNAPPRGRGRPPGPKGVHNPPNPKRPRPYPYALRQRAVQLHLEEGLKAGDRVVTDGQYKLQQGSKVEEAGRDNPSKSKRDHAKKS